MLRRITKKAGRFAAGVLHDWPLSVWNDVAVDAKFTKKDGSADLDAFSTPEEMNTVLQKRNSGGKAQNRSAARAGAH